MPILYKDLSVDQGVSYPNLVDPDTYEWRTGTADPVTGVVPLVNLLGYSAKFEIRANPTAPDPPLLTLTDGSGIILGGALGTVVIAITAAQSNALPTGVLAYDLILTSGSGQVYKFMSGSITINPLVSR